MSLVTSDLALFIGSPTVVIGFGAATLVLASALAYFLRNPTHKSNDGNESNGASNGVVVDHVELDKSKYPGGYLSIYFGSQTGTAEMFAKQIEKEGDDRGFKVRVVDLQDVTDNEDVGDNEELDERERLLLASFADPRYRDPESGRFKALFFMATYGEGEPTDNALQFIEAMKVRSGIADNINFDTGKEGFSSFLRDMDFAVFGLGNKQYENYNNTAKLTDEALNRCKGTRITPIGLGDDDDDLEGDFETWKEKSLWPALMAKYIDDDAKNALAEAASKGGANKLPECPFESVFMPELKGKHVPKDACVSNGKTPTSTKHYFNAVDCPVTENRELRDPSDSGSTVHVEIDISKCKNTLTYKTADNLGVLPVNDTATVEKLAKALGYDLDDVFRLVPKSEDGKDAGKTAIPFPTPCTVRECLERYCDLHGSPRRSDLKQLAQYAGDDIDRKALLRMSSKEGKSEYREKVVQSHIGIVDIVSRLCPSIACPLEHFITVCPRLQPRYYTISSSSSCHPDSIHATVAVLETGKKDGSTYKGLCSGHLAGMAKDGMVRIFLRESTFRLPKEPERPIIMVGPGTGIAPMRAFLHERGLMRKTIEDKEHGSNILYFGCKKRTMDYIYRDELQSFEEDGTLTELHAAFSREQKEKVYVQHLLRNRGKETWDLISNQGASIFVCGGVQMGADVSHVLQDIISEQGEMKKEDAKHFLEKLSTDGRYVQELWS